MKTVVALLFGVVFVSLMAVPARAQKSPEIMVDDIQVQQVHHGGIEYAWFVVSCTVRNNSEKSGNVSVVLRTIDQWAFDRKPFRLSGYVEAGKSARLSVLDFMDYNLFKGLRKYQVKSAELH